MKSTSALIFLLIIVQAIDGMEVSEGDSCSWSLGSGKAKEAYSFHSSIGSSYDTDYGSEDQKSKRLTYSVLNPVQVTLNPPLKRPRTRSLSLPKKYAIQKKSPKRRSLELTPNGPDPEKHQLDEMLDALNSWIVMLMLKVPKNCVTIEDFIQKKRALLKFVLAIFMDAAERHNDSLNIEYAERKKKEIEDDERQLNHLSAQKNLELAYVSFENADEVKTSIKLSTDMESLLKEQKLFYNYAQSYCAEAYQFYQKVEDCGGAQQDENLRKVDELLQKVKSEIKKFPDDYIHSKNLCWAARKLIAQIKEIKEEIKSFKEFTNFLEEKRSKIDSPRKRTAWVTKINKIGGILGSNSNREKKKKKEKVKKIITTLGAKTKTSKAEERYNVEVKEMLSKALKGKELESYYKAIMEYKIKKNKFRYDQRLKEIHRFRKEASKLLIKAFSLNPQLKILKMINVNIKKMENNNKKRRALNKETAILGESFKEIEEHLDNFLGMAERVHKKIEHKYSALNFANRM